MKREKKSKLQLRKNRGLGWVERVNRVSRVGL